MSRFIISGVKVAAGIDQSREKGITMNKSLQIHGLLAALLLVAGGAEAAGLGKMSILSALGQPLRAEIELLSVSPEELGTVDARLANSEAFRQARIQRGEVHGDLNFRIEQRPDGKPFLKVTSNAPVQDPFVELLIELNWSSGRILREYTVLLDPPGEARQEVAKSPARAPETGVAAKPATRPAKPEAHTPTGTAKEAAASGEAPRQYGPVKGGETLHSIAVKVLHKDVTLEMMVASLYQANKMAFTNDNMNLLKKGQVLKVPDRDAVMLMVSPHQAKQLIRNHAATWHAYRGQVADAAVKAPADAKTPSPATGKIAPAKPQEAAPPPSASKDVLKLSKGEPAKGQPDSQAMQRIQSLEEELAAKSRALQEAQDRVAQLEKTVSDLQKLMSMKSPGATPPADTASAPADAGTPAPAEPAPAKKAEMPKAKVKAPIAPPPEERGWFSGLLENPLYLGGLAAAVLLSGLLAYMVVSNRRRKVMASFEQSVLSGGDQFKTAIFRTGAGKTVGTVKTQEPMTELSRLGLGAIDTHEVDPIAEAEVYMAYGRDAQAEEILKAAMVKDPSRQEIPLKLLEIYAAREDKVAFETQASELYAALGGEATPVWMKAAEMGRTLDPENPMYQLTGAAETSSSPVIEAPMPEPALEVPAAEPAVAIETAFAPPPEPSKPTEEDNVIEFDIPLEAAPEAASIPPETQETKADTIGSDMPLDFEPIEIELDAPSAPSADVTVASTGAPSAGMGDLDIASLPEVPGRESGPDLEFSVPEIDLSASHDLGTGIDLAAGMDQVPEIDRAPRIELEPEIEIKANPGLDQELDEIGAQLSAGASALDVPGFEIVTETPATSAVPELDFTGIDLDLNDLPEPAVVTEAADLAPQIDPELWEEVNTKMDLAKAYLEMGDREGAREILQEILNEGDARQKAEASKLIAETE
jgi:pilus assembly protein FimV